MPVQGGARCPGAPPVPPPMLVFAVVLKEALRPLLPALPQEKENVYPDGETAPAAGREQQDGADQLETIESSPEVYTPEQETPRRAEGRVRGRTPPLPPGRRRGGTPPLPPTHRRSGTPPHRRGGTPPLPPARRGGTPPLPPPGHRRGGTPPLPPGYRRGGTPPLPPPNRRGRTPPLRPGGCRLGSIVRC